MTHEERLTRSTSCITRIPRARSTIQPCDPEAGANRRGSWLLSQVGRVRSSSPQAPEFSGEACALEGKCDLAKERSVLMSSPMLLEKYSCSGSPRCLTGLAGIHRAQIRTTPGAPHIAQGEKLKR